MSKMLAILSDSASKQKPTMFPYLGTDEQYSQGI